MNAQVIATSLNHQIISPYTSFIAIEKHPKVSSLFAKNNLSGAQKSKNNAIQAHESLMVAMPKTAIGWQLQLLIGLALLLLAKIVSRYERLH